MNSASMILVFLALVAIAFAVKSLVDEQKQQFLEFQHKYKKWYKTTAEFDYRFQVFQENLKTAAESQKKNPLAKFGVTKFSDLTQEEFRSSYLMSPSDADIKSRVKLPEKDFSLAHPVNKAGCQPDPTTYDWFRCGVCTPVYDQGQCGSCWAFSATETIESYYVIAGHPLTSLSMEQVVDCDPWDSGCSGGMPINAYQYVQEGGIEPFSDYPYTAGGGVAGQCQFVAKDVIANVSSFNSISGGEPALYKQLSSSSGGPISVCLDASEWNSYSGGVLTSCGNQMDHCVQLTGYSGYSSSGSYWIVRNSWGGDWGESGFIWISIGSDLCGIADNASTVVATTA